MHYTFGTQQFTPEEAQDMMHNTQLMKAQGPELLFEPSANETYETPEEDDSLSSDNCFDSDGSLDSDDNLVRDEDPNAARKTYPVERVSTDDEHKHGRQDLKLGSDASKAQGKKLGQLEGAQTESGTSNDIEGGPKRTKWLTQYFQQEEGLEYYWCAIRKQFLFFSF